MKTYKEQRLAEQEDYRKFILSAILVMLGVVVMVSAIGYSILHYQSGMNTCIGKGYTKSYCQYLLK